MGKKNISKFNKFLIVLVIIIVFLLILILNQDKMAEKQYKKVLLIGIDAMDYKVTNKLIQESKLPNFAKLAKEGSFLQLNTTYPPESPVAWSSISTGVNPGKHNMFDFITRNPKTYLPELSISKQSGFSTNYISTVKATPFWKITSKADIPTTVIRWPVTFPPNKIKGNLLSGLGVPDIKGLLSGYSFYSEEIIKKEKVINVKKEKNIVNTYVLGPKIQKINKIEDIKQDMVIEILDNNSINLIINKNTYEIKTKKWSDWISVKFDAGFLKNVYGIFKVYLNNTKPLQMYITTIQIDPNNPITDISYPKDYSKKLAGDIGLYYTLGMPEETSGYDDGFLDEKAFLEQVNEIEAERDKMFWKEFNEFNKKDSAVFAFAYDSSDRLQHMFWDNTLEDKELKINQNIVDYYVKKDEFLGNVLNKIDNNTLVLIFSDHGFNSFEKAVNINQWLVENKLMTLTKELEEGEEAPLFEYVDWDNTKAYSVGFASLYINVKGREKKGIVIDREKIVNEIIVKLENLSDDNGNKVVNKAYKREEVYSGDYLENAPDIIIGFNPGYRMSWQSAVGGFTKKIVFENEKKWQGDHLIDPNFVPGVLFSNKKINKTSASVLDITPTILDFFNLKENMDGETLLK